ncbi:hypothetical protein N7539_003694 [Penicillium diatomitis]|uniref:Rhamnogalacturonan lyase domain-containing protein n=1 Tax=Penicillium diatomitis TaxID=2819901 RepID=A0A9X0BXT0_9EURO|nr:uncharacterized protein N7539_003694 [Penicillium diatomitis]KAJ5488804.1 hypothetical protein N7539_003694 [Penicillium diatomitis]
MPPRSPFLTQLDGSSWSFGNNVWNLTPESTYGVKLMYNGRDCIGDAQLLAITGRTDIKDEELPLLSDYLPQNKVQGERPGWGRMAAVTLPSMTLRHAHGTRTSLVRRESTTGDVVQLNMIHGTPFMASSKDLPPEGKIWGPWLGYLIDGDKEDVTQRAAEESQSWPYKWLADEGYHSRATADLPPPRQCSWAIQIPPRLPWTWAPTINTRSMPTKAENSNSPTSVPEHMVDKPGPTEVKVTIKKSKRTNLGHLPGKISPKEKLFQIGDFDRYRYGFLHGGAPYQHGLVAACPADLTYTLAGLKRTDRGNWTVRFSTPGIRESAAPELIVSVAGYASEASSNILANGVQVGNMTRGSALLPSDPISVSLRDGC